MRVLIVEDDKESRHLLRRAIRRIATSVRECSNELDALAIYEHCRPDVVLMNLSDTDGLRASKQILEFDPCAHIVMVADKEDWTAHGSVSKSGARNYVLKQNLSDWYS
jgi:DNA-binding response OmpR family regulator